MNKVLYFLVVMAVIAQTYTAPAENGETGADSASKGADSATKGADSAVKGAEGQAKQTANNIEKTAGSGGNGMPNPFGVITPFVKMGKGAVAEGESMLNGFMGMIPDRLPMQGMFQTNI